MVCIQSILVRFILLLCYFFSPTISLQFPFKVSVLSLAPTVTRSFAHPATGKHTLLLTLKACSRRNTSSPEKPTKPKCPRITYLCLTSPCRNPSSSLTMVNMRSGLVSFFPFLFFFNECFSHRSHVAQQASSRPRTLALLFSSTWRAVIVRTSASSAAKLTRNPAI